MADFRTKPAREWEALNPVLRNGEPGYERGTGRMKVGDGRTLWKDLPYIAAAVSTAPGATSPAVLAHINSAEPHPAYDEGPSLLLLYQNAKV